MRRAAIYLEGDEGGLIKGSGGEGLRFRGIVARFLFLSLCLRLGGVAFGIWRPGMVVGWDEVSEGDGGGSNR